MKKNTILSLLIVVFLVVAGFAFAGGQQEAAPEQQQAGMEETGEVVTDEWVIPFLNVLTGPIAGIGEYLLWGAERAAEEINAAGGVRGVPVRIQAIDTGMDPNKGIVEMGRLAEGDALTVMGPVPEPVIMASMPTAVENGLFAFTSTTSYEYAVEFFPWSISWFAPTDDKLPPVVTAWAEKHPDMDSVVQFVENYGPWPGMANAHELGVEAAGKTPLNNVEVPTDAVTFGPLIVRALSQNPDGVILATSDEKAAKIIRELKNRGWEDMSKILIFNSADAPALYTTGGDALDGTMIYNYTNPFLDTARWNAYEEAYAASHDGQSPPSLSTHYYDSVYMIAEAIEEMELTGNPDKLQEERRMIRDYCRDVKNFEGLQFTWSMSDGVPTDKPLFLFDIQNAKKQLIEEVRPN